MKRTVLIGITVVAVLFGVVAYAYAVDASPATQVNATVPSVLEITAPASVTITLDTYGAADISGSTTASVTGKANKLATMSAVVTPGGFTTLDSTLETPVANLRGGNISQTDTITGLVDYNVDGGSSISGSITYSLL